MARHMIVRKANDLIMAKYKMTLEENRLILYLTSLIDRYDEDFKEYEISVKDFCELSGFPTNNFYRYFHNMCDSLLQKRIDLIENGRVVQLCWLSQATYYPNQGRVTLAFASALKPYLLQLKGNFTYYDLKNVRLLRSNFAIRMYELLKQYEKLGKRTFLLDDLKAVLGVEKNYSQYSDFKQKVLLISQRELKEKCDICFEFDEQKTGRKVSRLLFKIYRNEKNCVIDAVDAEYIEVKTPLPSEDRQDKPIAPPILLLPPLLAEGRQDKPIPLLPPLSAEDRQDKPAPPQEPDNSLEIARQLWFIEENLPIQSLISIYRAANGDAELIRRRYARMRGSDGVRDVTAWMIDAVRRSDEQYQSTPKAAVAREEPRPNRFHNFPERNNDYNEFERQELEQFKKIIRK